jgi:hypothetical protein
MLQTLRASTTACLVAACTLTPAALGHPGSGIGVDRRGRVFFVDTGQGVWVIERDGRVVSHAGPSFHWMTLDPASRFGETSFPHRADADIQAAGGDPMVLLSGETPIALGRDGALYFPEPRDDGRLRMVRMTAAGERSDFAVLPAESDGAPLRWLNGVAAAEDGAIYYAENASVRRIDAGGAITTVAAGVEVRDCERLPGLPAELGPLLRGLAVGENGAVYVAASGCSAVLRIDAGGEITSILRASPPWAPTGVALHGAEVYVLEYLHTSGAADRREWIPRVRKLSPDGTVTILATIERE